MALLINDVDILLETASLDEFEAAEKNKLLVRYELRESICSPVVIITDQ